MKKLFLTSVCFFFAFTAFAQELSKEEKKKMKEELKGYLNDLAGYRAKMQDIQITLDSNDAEIRRQKDDLAFAAAKQAELENKVTDLIAEVQRCHADKSVRNGIYTGGDTTTYPENRTSQKIKYVIAESTDNYSEGTNSAAASKSDGKANNEEVAGEKIANDITTHENKIGEKATNKETAYSSYSSDNESQSGTVYKIQFGLYKKFSINKYFDEPKHIGYETEDGLNRYVVSYFSDVNTAKKFVEDIRRMGIKDAFVAKYVDGKRVYGWSEDSKYEGKTAPSNLKEALEMNKKEKKVN